MENKPHYIEYEDGTRVLLDEDDFPEATEAFFKNAVYGLDGLAYLLGEEFVAPLRKAGRPTVVKPKKITTFKLSQEVIEAIKATGRGYNARVDAALRAAFIGS